MMAESVIKSMESLNSELEVISSTEKNAEKNAKENVVDVEEGDARGTVPITRKRRLISVVWNHFDKIDVPNGGKGKCHYCGVTLDASGSYGTNKLWRHVQGKCPKFRLDKGGDIKQQILKMGKNKDGSAFVETFKFNQENSRRDLAKAIILHEYPFSIVDHAGFRKFVKNLQPSFVMIKRKTITKDCIDIFEDLKGKVQDMLDTNEGRITITSDMWKSLQNFSYISITSHFIDVNWVLQKRILNFSQVDGSHTGVDICSIIYKKLLEWKIDGKLFSVVLDNASANIVAARELRSILQASGEIPVNGDFLHVRCCAHILNLIVQDGLNAVKGALFKIRESVKYVKNSVQREATFKKIASTNPSTSNISLVLDVTTRWNSTYNMLDVALRFRDVFVHFGRLDKDFKTLPNPEEWDDVKIIHQCLAPFLELTELWSGTKYPTSNLFFSMVCELKMSLKEWLSSDNILQSSLAANMMEKYDKYWNETCIILAVASIMDPRIKLMSMEYYFPRLFDNGMKKIDEVKTSLFGLYDEYKESYKHKTFNNGSSSSTIVNGSCSLVSTSIGKNARLKSLSKFIAECSSSQPTKNELELYLEEVAVPFSEDVAEEFDILSWLRVNAAKYPVLAKMARDILAIPISTVASEEAFSTGGRVIDKYRSNLKPETVEALICAQNWLRNEYEAQGKSGSNSLTTVYSAEDLDGEFCNDSGEMQFELNPQSS